MIRAEEAKHLPPPPPESVQEFVRSAEQLDYKAAVILGVVEGVTEYLPVSSTGHLLLANNFLGLDQEVAVTGKDGEQIFTMEKAALPVRVWDSVVGSQSQPPAEVPFTLKNAADAYVIVIQFGAILAVLFAYWKRVEGLITGMLTGKRESWQLGSNLIVAFLPAAVIGLLFNKFIEQKLFGVWPVIFALFVGGWVMLWMEHRHRKMVAKGLGNGTDLETLTWKKSLGIGIAQCFAMWPGTSRSMATICGGYWVGLSPAQATEFS
ncbi:MAG: undecaprenyl-diphosphate phosphatase, partial [Puniceicoccales bacterium]|nr:undecaprenyl-diphosphate phosphatase [Puniceicoccales bacterium]